jgi:hypothetical protein
MHSLPKALQFSDHLIHLPPSIMEKSSSLFSNPNPNPTSTQLRQEFQHEEFIMSNDGIEEESRLHFQLPMHSLPKSLQFSNHLIHLSQSTMENFEP